MIDLSGSSALYTKTSPCSAKIKERILLTRQDSPKPTYHVVFDIEQTGLRFTPGDSLAVIPENREDAVNALLSLTGSDPEEIIRDPRSDTDMPLFSYFSSRVNLSKISPALLEAAVSGDLHFEKKEWLRSLLQPENKPALLQFLAENDLLDLFAEIPGAGPLIQSMLGLFSPLLPRFYSVSSSLRAHPGEVHLLVALASHKGKRGMEYGVASHFLCDSASPARTVGIYVQPSRHFKLPENPNADLIMVGPGTGVAPYRAFLQERIATGAPGENWLFFGGRNRDGDFLYRDFWLTLEKQGILRLSTAFSRDQQEKEYVQHKLLLHSKEVFAKLERGAYFYVCGDAKNMAKDVESCLIGIVQKEGSLSTEAAAAYVKALRASKRYLTDVY